jgi:hypothetical protein
VWLSVIASSRNTRPKGRRTETADCYALMPHRHAARSELLRIASA